MKKLEFTKLASIFAGVAVMFGFLALLGGAFFVLSGTNSGKFYWGVSLLVSGLSLLSVSALLGTISEISHNIAALGMSSNGTLMPTNSRKPPM